MACKRCVKEVVKVDNIYNCDRCKKNDDWAMQRFRFVVHVVDGKSNATFLLWDRESVQLLGRRVAEVIASDNRAAEVDYIPREIEDKLVGQGVLFKVQLRNDIEFRINHPITVNKVCNLAEVVNKFVPPNVDLQDSKADVGLKELCFGSDLAEIEDCTFVTPISSTLTKDVEAELVPECSAKRCLDEDFSSCDDEVVKKNKSDISFEDLDNNQDGVFCVELKI